MFMPLIRSECGEAKSNDTSNTVLIYLGSIKEIKKKAKLNNRQHVTDTVQ